MTDQHIVGIDAATQAATPRWTVSIDGRELTNLQGRYQGQVGEDEWDTIRDTAARLLSNCPDPSGAASTSTGLALGKVQSGKTLSYTTLIALAMDNGYRFTVVLAGTKNPLLNQNYGRLSADLETTDANVIPFRNPVATDGQVIRSVIEGGSHALLVVLKNRKRIDDLRAALAAGDLRNFPSLIIDDEGDEASLNTQFRRGTESAVYASILRLRQTLDFHAYVAYTATPQANLLISGIDGLSPDFGILIPPGAAYCGGSIFFGPNADYIRTIPVQDATQATQVTDSLRIALASFFVGAAVRHLREQTEWHSMLVHTSQLKVDHETLQSTLRELVLHWREQLQLPADDPAHRQLVPLFQSAYEDIRRTVGDQPGWDEIYQRLPAELAATEVWMVNSLASGRDPIATPFRLRNNILVGGNMLARGVTIPGLAVTYIIRRAQNETNADTMEQRARWFGYKRSYLDLCRIYLTEQLRADYTELLRHEDDFWDALRRHERQGLPVRQWPRMFALDPSLGINPTRSNVANFKQFRGAQWDIQNIAIHDSAVAGRNGSAAQRFCASLSLEPFRIGNVEHSIASNVPTERVISDLLAHIEAQGTDWENAYYAEFLARLSMSNRLPDMDVVAMVQGTFRKHSLDDKARIPNLMQGKSPNRPATDPLFYPGDREIHADRVQLQIHFVTLQPKSGADVNSLALALYIPNTPQYDLRYVIRDET